LPTPHPPQKNPNHPPPPPKKKRKKKKKKKKKKTKKNQPKTKISHRSACAAKRKRPLILNGTLEYFFYRTWCEKEIESHLHSWEKKEKDIKVRKRGRNEEDTE